MDEAENAAATDKTAFDSMQDSLTSPRRAGMCRMIVVTLAGSWQRLLRGLPATEAARMRPSQARWQARLVWARPVQRFVTSFSLL